MQRLESSLRKEIKISNTICTADLKQSVDIGSFNKYKFLSSNLDLYRCGYVKDSSMTGRVTVFASGKLISAGTKSPEQAKKELERASQILQKYNLIKSYKIISQIRNLVSSCHLGRKMHLETLARNLPRSIYEPDQFPALIHRIRGSIVALIFASGKIILVGAKTINELNEAFFELQHQTKMDRGGQVGYKNSFN